MIPVEMDLIITFGKDDRKFVTLDLSQFKHRPVSIGELGEMGRYIEFTDSNTGERLWVNPSFIRSITVLRERENRLNG